MVGIRIDMVLEVGLSPETRHFLSNLFTPNNDRVLNALSVLEKNVSKIIDDKITAYAAQVKDYFAQTNANLDNIVADQQGLSQKVTDLQAQIAADQNSDLSPTSQALLDGLVADAQAVAARTKVTADSIPDAPPAPPVG